jgi:calcineurin-like phosphoesterase family protein
MRWMLPFMKFWFTADTHFGHEKIIGYCGRSFASVEDMNSALIAKWNERVSPGDVVYHLGDFGFLRRLGTGVPRDAIKSLLKSLNGQVHLIKGNHDYQNYSQEVYNCFASVADIRDKTIDGQRIIMCHYAMRVWPGSNKGSWMLYGHSHGNLSDNPNARSIDVGVDCHGMAPISFEDIVIIMGRKSQSTSEIFEEEDL